MHCLLFTGEKQAKSYLLFVPCIANYRTKRIFVDNSGTRFLLLIVVVAIENKLQHRLYGERIVRFSLCPYRAGCGSRKSSAEVTAHYCVFSYSNMVYGTMDVMVLFYVHSVQIRLLHALLDLSVDENKLQKVSVLR